MAGVGRSVVPRTVEEKRRQNTMGAVKLHPCFILQLILDGHIGVLELPALLLCLFPQPAVLQQRQVMGDLLFKC